MRKRSKYLAGPPETHASVAETFLQDAKGALAQARSCADLAHVKWSLGAASENILWAPSRERGALRAAFADINGSTNERLRACLTHSASGLGRRKRRR